MGQQTVRASDPYLYLYLYLIFLPPCTCLLWKEDFLQASGFPVRIAIGLLGGAPTGSDFYLTKRIRKFHQSLTRSNCHLASLGVFMKRKQKLVPEISVSHENGKGAAHRSLLTRNPTAHSERTPPLPSDSFGPLLEMLHERHHFHHFLGPFLPCSLLSLWQENALLLTLS